MKHLSALLLVSAILALAACGGGSSSTGSSGTNNSDPPVAGNWQFNMTAPGDLSFGGGIQSGFLMQKGSAITGSLAYSVTGAVPPSAPGTRSPVCNSGSAPVTGTINGDKVMLTAPAGGQTFTLTGTISADGSTMLGTYTSSAGPMVNGMPCGSGQSGLTWTALLIPRLNGTVQGSFHSKSTDQDFLVSGSLQQGENVGASSATITGTLTFQNYSCLGSAAHQTINVNGEISGSAVILQMFADSGANIGQIGQSNALNPQVSSVYFQSVASGGYVLQNSNSQLAYGGYSATTKACAYDYGNICLAMGSATDCTQPITMTPGTLTFPSQIVGATSTSQTVTITNTDVSGGTLGGLSLSWRPGGGSLGYSDFNGWPNFLEVDSCASTPGGTFSLPPQASCTVTIFFSPQQSCTWLPNSGGVAPASCPPFASGSKLNASLAVNSSKSADGDKTFAVPIGGVGLSAVVPSTPELDFGPEAAGESSAPQTLSFTNQGLFSVQILPKADPQNACSTASVTLKQPIQTGQVDGLRVVQGTNLATVAPNGRPTVSYNCDFDASSKAANFQITSDNCTGTLLYPSDTCMISVTYVPQPSTPSFNGLDYFLELNTQQCAGSSAQPNCEIDSGRFPVELRVNPTSPLRLSPAAGLDFAPQKNGTMSDLPLTVTLTDDPSDPRRGAVSFQGIVANGDYIESDNCGGSLAVGSSCTISITFAPMATGYRQGTITINYTVPSQPILSSPQVQVIRLRGTGQ